MSMEVQATDAYKAQLIVTDLQIEPHQERANCYIVSQTAKAPLVGLTPYRRRM